MVRSIPRQWERQTGRWRPRPTWYGKMVIQVQCVTCWQPLPAPPRPGAVEAPTTPAVKMGEPYWRDARWDDIFPDASRDLL